MEHEDDCRDLSISKRALKGGGLLASLVVQIAVPSGLAL